jgi:hypothetical protein
LGGESESAQPVEKHAQCTEREIVMQTIQGSNKNENYY